MKNNESIEHIFMQITNFGVLTIKLSSEAYKYNDSVIMKLSYWSKYNNSVIMKLPIEVIDTLE